MTSFLVARKELNRFRLSAFLALAIAFIWQAPPLRAQFVYVGNYKDNSVTAYSIGERIPWLHNR